MEGDFLGGPPMLPMQGAWVQTPIRKLDPTYHNQEFAGHN